MKKQNMKNELRVSIFLTFIVIEVIMQSSWAKASNSLPQLYCWETVIPVFQVGDAYWCRSYCERKAIIVFLWSRYGLHTLDLTVVLDIGIRLAQEWDCQLSVIDGKEPMGPHTAREPSDYRWFFEKSLSVTIQPPMIYT